MSNEIKKFIDAELPPGTAPVSLDVDTVMRGNQTARVKRRLMGGGGVFVSVVAVVALVLGVMALVPGGDGGPDDAATKSTIDELELDPGKEYYWDGPVSTRATEASKAYTTAFWDYFDKQHPDIDLVYGTFTGDEKVVTEDFTDYSFFLASGYELYEGDEFDNSDDGEPLGERTILNMFDKNDPETESAWSGCCGAGLRYSDDKKDTDKFELDVLPQGSFTKDTEDVLDPAYFGPKATHDVDKVTGPNGEQIRNVSVKFPDDSDGGHNVGRATVVYRTDGSAVVVRAMSGVDWGFDEEIKLSFEDMQGMALALPDDPID